MSKSRIFSFSPPGIRVQLTLWYTIVSATLMLLFGITFYVSFQGLLASSFDTSLRMRSQQVAEGVYLRNNVLHVDKIVSELPELDATAALVDSNGVQPDSTENDNTDNESMVRSLFDDNNVVVRVLDLHGRVLYLTPAFSQLKLPDESIKQPLKGNPWYGTIGSTTQQPIRLYSTMLVTNGHIVGVVQVGQSLGRLNGILQRILLSLLMITPFILLFCGLISYWLAGRAFIPIHRLTHTAREVGAKDLHRRVPVPVAHDEVRALSIIFNEMIGRLERSFSQQRRFVADASHELRTPVAVIRNMTEVALAQASSRDEYETVLKEINSESERLGRLIGDLLALARADEGQVQLDVEAVRLDLLVLDVIASLEPLASERNIVVYPGRLDCATVLGDAARLIQIIIGLVDNAIKYTNPGGLVRVSVEVCSSHVHLSVRDTGIGIPEEALEHIFERFYRADPARSKVVGGSGLGLAIVDWAVRLHKGVVTVESKIKKGTTFTVTLPTAPEP